MEKQEYVMKGTVKGLTEILQKDFAMCLDEAKFFVYSMTEWHSEEKVNSICKEEMDAWYLAEEDKYEGQILNTHLVISFTDMKREAYHAAYDFFIKYFFSKKIDPSLIGVDLVRLVATSIKKVKDTDYCVYARIVELCMGHKDSFFDVNEVITANKYGKCDYQEDGWKCTYLGKDDTCTCDEKKMGLALAELEQQNIIKRVGESWMLVR